MEMVKYRIAHDAVANVKINDLFDEIWPKTMNLVCWTWEIISKGKYKWNAIS